MDVLRDQAEVERLAENILTDKQLIIDLDRRRNENREALGCFRRNEVDNKLWFFSGGLVMKMGKDSARGIIEQEQQQLDSEISSLRTQMKEKMTELEKLENILHPDATRPGAVTASSYSTLKPANLNELMHN